jgi:protein-disulfide isomerase
MRLVLPVGPRDHTRGSDDALVTLLEYGDYECPYCGRASIVLKEVEVALGTNLLYVFRHFPLSMVHPRARTAAEAAEAAAAQGVFWPMHDLLFENQNALEAEDLLGYAGELGLDRERFAREVEERVHSARVREDFLSGVRSGVNGTPTFFIDGERYEGSWQKDALLGVLEARLRAGGRRRAG